MKPHPISCNSLSFVAFLVTGLLLINVVEADSSSFEHPGIEWKFQKEVPIEARIQVDQLQPADYAQLAQVHSLKAISLSGKQFTDENLKTLTALANIESILINGTVLTDDGYRFFVRWQKLKKLSLFHPSRDVKAFTGAGLAYLKDVATLESLTFAGATAGNAAFTAVAQISQLQEFRQWHNLENEQAIAELLALKNLKSLMIGQRLPAWGKQTPPSFYDVTLKSISQMKSLERLTLQEARLSVTGLQELQKLPNLKQLTMKLVDISLADQQQLKQLLPEVDVQIEPLDAAGEEMLAKKLKL